MNVPVTTLQLTHDKLNELQADNNEQLNMHIDTVQRAFDFFLKYDGTDISAEEQLALLKDLEWLRGDLCDLRPLDCETEQYDDDGDENNQCYIDEQPVS